MLDYGVTKNFDYAIVNNEFTFQQYIENLINIALFTKGRANAEQVPEPIHRGGYVGNILYGKNNKVGSTLWVYTRQQINTQENANEIQRIVYNDLRFLITRKLAKTINVTVARFQNQLSITIRVDNLQPIKYNL